MDEAVIDADLTASQGRADGGVGREDEVLEGVLDRAQRADDCPRATDTGAADRQDFLAEGETGGIDLAPRLDDRAVGDRALGAQGAGRGPGGYAQLEQRTGLDRRDAEVVVAGIAQDERARPRADAADIEAAATGDQRGDRQRLRRGVVDLEFTETAVAEVEGQRGRGGGAGVLEHARLICSAAEDGREGTLTERLSSAGGGQRVDRQRAVEHGDLAGEGVGTGEHQGARAGLGEAVGLREIQNRRSRRGDRRAERELRAAVDRLDVGVGSDGAARTRRGDHHTRVDVGGIGEARQHRDGGERGRSLRERGRGVIGDDRRNRQRVRAGTVLEDDEVRGARDAAGLQGARGTGNRGRSHRSRRHQDA